MTADIVSEIDQLGASISDMDATLDRHDDEIVALQSHVTTLYRRISSLIDLLGLQEK